MNKALFTRASELRENSEEAIYKLAVPIAYNIDTMVKTYNLIVGRRLIVRFESPNADVTALIMKELRQAGWDDVYDITDTRTDKEYSTNYTLIPVNINGNTWVKLRVPKPVGRDLRD